MSSDLLDIFREQIPSETGIELATVMQADPLAIRLDNDEMVLKAEDGDLLVCEHVLEHDRQYSTDSQARGNMSVWGYIDELGNPEDLALTYPYITGNIKSDKQKVTFHAKLQAGDRVVVMALPGGQQYLIWDKVVIL